jgi:hypothetical protein
MSAACLTKSCLEKPDSVKIFWQDSDILKRNIKSSFYLVITLLPLGQIGIGIFFNFLQEFFQYPPYMGVKLPE